MTTVVETYLKNAIVSDVAYGDLNKNLTATDYFEILTKTDKEGKVKLSPSQAKAFAGVTEAKDSNGNVITYTGDDGKEHTKYKFVLKNKLDSGGNPIKDENGNYIKERAEGYTIVSTYNDPTTGYNGVLLKNNETGDLTIANRGTEPTSLEDLGDDASLTFKQVPEQFESMTTFVNKLISEGKITKEDTVIMDGHSLGGALTQMGTAAYSDYIDKAYTYNSPGAKDLNSNVYEKEEYEALKGKNTQTNKISSCNKVTLSNINNSIQLKYHKKYHTPITQFGIIYKNLKYVNNLEFKQYRMSG